MSKSLEDLVKLIDAQITAAHVAVDKAKNSASYDGGNHYARMSQAHSALAEVLITRYYLQVNMDEEMPF